MSLAQRSTLSIHNIKSKEILYICIYLLKIFHTVLEIKHCHCFLKCSLFHKQTSEESNSQSDEVNEVRTIKSTVLIMFPTVDLWYNILMDST